MTGVDGAFQLPAKSDSTVEIVANKTSVAFGYARNVSVGDRSVPLGTFADLTIVSKFRAGYEIVVTWDEFPSDLDAMVETVCFIASSDEQGRLGLGRPFSQPSF